MSKIEKMNLTNTKNVEEVRIGESTMRLLRCKAMLSDIFVEVNAVCDGRDGSNVREDVASCFNTAFSDLNLQLVKIMADVMDYVTVDRHYKEI